MKARIARWVSRAVFFAAVLALIATSKPKEWVVAAVLSGPTTAAAGRGLEVTIDASSEPRLRAGGVAPNLYNEGDTPCNSPWKVGSPRTCLLPPGATLTAVDIGGSCSDCSSTCAPPPGVFVKATTAEVPVWMDTVTSRLTAKLPDHAKDRVATGFTVLASGARFIRVTLTVTPVGGGTALLHQEQTCRLDPSGKLAGVYCSFLIYDTDVGPKPDVEVVAEATGWGTCAGSTCTDPKTLKIDTLEILK